MNHQVSRPRIGQSAVAIAGSLLWGLLEVIALARSRWMRRRA